MRFNPDVFAQPAVANAIARYQQTHGTSQPFKLIICNHNYWTNNNNNILGYFNFSGNQGKSPGDFIWPMGVGEGPQYNPQMMKQIFKEEMSAEMLNALFESVKGTNLTMAVLPVATTIDNGICRDLPLCFLPLIILCYISLIHTILDLTQNHSESKLDRTYLLLLSI